MRPSSRTIRNSLVGVALAALVLPARAGNFAGTTIVVVDDFWIQAEPSIDGDIVVYTDAQDHNDLNVYYVDLSSPDMAPVPVAVGPGSQRLHDVSGDRIVYTDISAALDAIFLYDIGTGTTTQLLESSGFGHSWPRIDGDVVAFVTVDGFNKDDIEYLNLSTGAGARLFTDTYDSRPAIGGDFIVFQRGFTGTAASVILYNIETREEANLGLGESPHTDGRTVAFLRKGADGLNVVHVYDIASGAGRVIERDPPHHQPHVDGDLLTFAVPNSNNVVLYHLPTDSWTHVAPPGFYAANNAISGNRVAYQATNTITLTEGIHVFEPVLLDELYGVNSADDSLARLNPTTGEATLVGQLDPTTDALTTIAMAVHPVDARLFAWTNSSLGSSAGFLMTVDNCTGQATRVSELTYPHDLGGLAFSRSGTLFAVNHQALYQVDVLTGQPVQVGEDHGVGNMHALDVGPDDKLYALGWNISGSNQLFVFDASTGESTPGPELDQDVGTIGSIAFAGDTLIGSAFNGTPGEILFDIDPATGHVSNVRQVTGGGPFFPALPQGMGFGPRCPVDVSPAALAFGDVPLGGLSSQIVTLQNLGYENFTVNAIVLASNSGFAVDAPTTPFVVPVGSTQDVTVHFMPFSLGAMDAVLSIDTNRLVTDVTLSGTGVQSEPPPPQDIHDLLEFFDTKVTQGTLVGAGQGNSASGRRGALRNMIEAAGDLVDGGMLAEACQQLQDAYRRTDGVSPPPDFVAGPAAAELAQLIQHLRGTLGCA